jgi:CHAT domain-containing protein
MQRVAGLEQRGLLVLSIQAPFDQLPFGALVLGDVPLCSFVDIVHVEGITAYEECHRRGPANCDSIYCLGSSDSDRIPAAESEVMSIGELFSAAGLGATIVVGVAATVASLRANASRYGVIHFACHAVDSTKERPAALKLAGISEEDSNLSSDRIVRELHLRPGAFVNLSCCVSASRVDSVGPRVAGLIQAFLVAGASECLGTLWAVRDWEAATFAHAFYERLLTGLSPTESLSAVQCDCHAGQFGDEMRDPRAWGGYVIYGSGR